MIRVVHPGSRILMLTFYPSRIPDPGVKKAPDPGSGSTTLQKSSDAVVFSRYGTDVAAVTDAAFATAGNSYLTFYNTAALGPKGIAKRMAKVCITEYTK
jgi:hypothetical protein